MSRSHRNTVRRNLDEAPDADLDVYATLDDVIQGYRWLLVETATFYLGENEQSDVDAEDLVQDLCVEVLEGELALSLDPRKALKDLKRVLIARCKRRGR
ncbi:MAG TPA: hypothetical protein VGL81_29530 [Polyangiaceae bacterium]|jgi:hypothetical protein